MMQKGQKKQSLKLLLTIACLLFGGIEQSVLGQELPKNKKDHCYALVLGGGGTKGAYEAGVFWGLVNGAKNKSEYAYDVISGVSAGTINGGALSVFEIGDEVHASQVISDYWQVLSTDQIYQRWWPFGLITGLGQTGLLNTSPLRNFMKNYFDEHGYDLKRRVSFLGVDAVNGDLLHFNETISDEAKLNGAMTSSAVPFAFKSQNWNFDGQNVVGIDGGAAWGIDIGSAVHRCQEVVDDDSKITVDVVGCSTNRMPSYSTNEASHAIDNFFRFSELKSYHNTVSDVAELMAAYPKVNYRHYVEPSQALPTASVMDGTNSTCTWPMQELGRLDGANALGQEGAIFQKVQEYLDSEDMKRSWPRVGEYLRYIRDQFRDENQKEIDFGCKITLWDLLL